MAKVDDGKGQITKSGAPGDIGVAAAAVRQASDQAPSACSPSPLERLLAQSRPPLPPPAPASFVGFCVDVRHPTLRGRALIRWTAAGAAGTEERWLPCLQSLALREGDRVMVTAPSNFDEPVVVGVLDGFTPRPEATPTLSHVIELKPDERLLVRAPDGTPLMEVQPTPEGPAVSLLSTALAVRVPGQLTFEADAIDLRARRGAVAITASDDVEINGELVRLNSPKGVSPARPLNAADEAEGASAKSQGYASVPEPSRCSS